MDNPLLASRIREKVLYVARSNIGFGEEGGNNRGDLIRAMGGRQGEEWCALFAGYCYRRAYQILDMEQPTWPYRYANRPEPSAKALTKRLGVGNRIWNPLDESAAPPLPGDIVCWSRGFLGWQGHVGIVSDVIRYGAGLYAFKYIAGNEGRDGIVKERNGKRAKLWRMAGLA